MFQHYLKMMFRNKRKSALLIIQLLCSFLILFGILSIILHNYRNYHQASTLSTDNILVASIDFHRDTIPNLNLIRQKMEENLSVEAYALTSENQPFSQFMIRQPVKYQEAEIVAELIKTEPDYFPIFGLKILEGEWFTSSRSSDDVAVISRKLKEHWFGKESPLGEFITINNNGTQVLKVIGVVDSYKHNDDYTPLDFAVIKPILPKDYINKVVIKVTSAKSSSNAGRNIATDLASLNREWSVELKSLEDLRFEKNNYVVIPVLILSILGIFFIVNSILGIFGLLTLNISRRRTEIGIRRSIGATMSAIIFQLVTEMLLLAFLALLLGLMITLPFPLNNMFGVPTMTYVIAICLAVFLICALVMAFSYFPSKSAAKVPPSQVLHG
jgi:putative ABC transport system permease protein